MLLLFLSFKLLFLQVNNLLSLFLTQFYNDNYFSYQLSTFAILLTIRQSLKSSTLYTQGKCQIIKYLSLLLYRNNFDNTTIAKKLNIVYTRQMSNK